MRTKLYARVPSRMDSRGFSLVELMVAVAISLMLLAGVIAIFASSRASYETTDRLSRIQENGRFALDQIVTDTRAAGFVGCARVPTYVSSALDNATDINWNFLDSPVRGYQFVSSGSYSPALPTTHVPDAADNSDVLVVRRPKRDARPLRLLTDLSGPEDDLTVANVSNSGLQADDIALLYSCEAQAYFQVRSFSGGTITHAAGGGGTRTPGNATGSVSYTFRRNAEVIPVETVTYYVRASSGGPPGSTSLWRRIGANTPEELVEGVEQMQLRFGVDTNNDSLVDEYRTADAVADWGAVYSVEIALLIRSETGYGSERDTQTYQLADVVVAAPNDTLIREVFSATVGIRNRIRVN